MSWCDDKVCILGSDIDDLHDYVIDDGVDVAFALKVLL